MTLPETRAPLRNAPCPCGSGKKYKHCCGAKAAESGAPDRPAVQKGKRDFWLIALGLLVVVAVSIVALISVNRRPPATPLATPARLPMNPAHTPKAFEYDAANNRHWDPAHGHWHNGPPPNAAK